MSDPAAAVVHAGDTGPATGSPTVTAMVPGPTKIATGVATSASKPREHHVVRGDTLVSISRRYSCDTKVLAKANNLQAPRYAIRQGQRLKLEGCTKSVGTPHRRFVVLASLSTTEIQRENNLQSRTFRCDSLKVGRGR